MTDRDLLAEAAAALYGAQWQTRLAGELCVAVRTVQRWVAGDRAVPRSALVALRAALERRSKEHSMELKRIARKLPRE